MGPAWSEIPVSPRYGQEDRPSLPAASKHSRMLHTRSRVPNGETAKTGVRQQSVLPGIDQRIYSRFRCPSHSGQTCKLSLISHYFGMPPENNYYNEVILNDPTLTVNNPVEGHEIQIIIGSPTKVAKSTLIDFAKKLTEHTRVNQGWSGVHAIVEFRELRDLSPLGEPTHTEGDLNAWIL